MDAKPTVSSQDTVDPVANRFYSVMLDARSMALTTEMVDSAEKILSSEKDNAKRALEQLWNLKKSLSGGHNETLDLLIQFYQTKIDALRTREDSVRKSSRETRTLLEERRRKSEEIASVKQQIDDCNRELLALQSKLEKLNVKEQELVLIETQLEKEVATSENEIVNEDDSDKVVNVDRNVDAVVEDEDIKDDFRHIVF